ncbi:MAG: hypothetical protein H8E15_05175 [Planctomycetes bacterium]|nr:hypothetical protein [Planctomycetota bacterium]
MSKVDQYQSVFRAADKPVFVFQAPQFRRVLLATDLPPAELAKFSQRLQAFIQPLGFGSDWQTLGADDFSDAPALLKLLEKHQPDLVITYRNLHSEAWRWPFSLGECVDLLTQATSYPVLLVPHPDANRAAAHALKTTNVVMAISGHLTGDDALVNAAAAFTLKSGDLWLSHVEDDAEFNRLIEVIGKIPALDTEVAKETIAEQLLKEPKDFIQSCAAGLQAVEVDLRVRELVVMGHRLTEYRRLIEEHSVDLLVLHCKDEDQSAMHGMAYPLAIELREIPMLLL